MAKSENITADAKQDWDAYWEGARGSVIPLGHVVDRPLITNFWRQVFDDVVNADNKNYRVLDLATGNGALLENLLQLENSAKLSITCVDSSVAAIESVKARFPLVNAQVSSIERMPFADASFDLVTSQFGIEYAKLESFSEVQRLVAPGGRIVFLTHHRQGYMFDECAANARAVSDLIRLKFVPLAHEFLAAAFKAAAGGSRKQYDKLAIGFQPVVEQVEQIVKLHQADAASGMIAQLYEDVGKIHSNILKYDSDEVLNWLASYNNGLAAYVGQMQSMCDAALSEDQFSDLCQSFNGSGFKITSAGPFGSAGDTRPIGWMLEATRLPSGIVISDDIAKSNIAAWVRSVVARATGEMSGQGVFGDESFIEARPEWHLPYELLIGKARLPRSQQGEKWFLATDTLLDTIPAAGIPTAREAARNFALRWQLQATQAGDDAEIIERAQALYQLTLMDELW